MTAHKLCLGYSRSSTTTYKFEFSIISKNINGKYGIYINENLIINLCSQAYNTVINIGNASDTKKAFLS